ncbi:MAG: biotin--[acetyl-CoA-carboxylase] ligase [Spirochaetales bacterium]|uniref:biotin--[biotin carboxyl-carrier protein] ligase n=1 Tax=Candidatus Thalassospirochaeta sargassi TaxID=3119039 RepID=A0AAJ1ML04_9SPIO|nr:biotin--[acetyl-CoA-carboxylase] ligase [Spirochaetales bacterium]
MVNNHSGRIKQILEILETSNRAVSGEELAAVLGVSRVAVWKIISGLKDKGYRIESNHSGYKLTASTDKPLPWELDSTAGPVEYHSQLDSTMKKASSLLDAGCSDGTTVIAGTQNEGKNRSGGSWVSPDGGLYLTRIRTVPFPAFYSEIYTLVLAEVTVRTLRHSFSIEAYVDWPCGISSGGKKLGGILTEFKGSGDMILGAAAGIGLNLNTTSDLPENAASLSSLTGVPVSVKQLAAELLHALDSADGSFPPSNAETLYNDCILQAGAAVIKTKNSDKKIRGRIIGLDLSGALIMETGDGHREYLFSGDEIEYEQQRQN